MATFQVPQFIDQKPKIIGPLTLVQFAYIAAASILSFAAFYTFTFFLWIVVTIVLEGIAVFLAFGKVNGQEIPKVIGSAFSYLFKPRVYVWKREMKKSSIDTSSIEKIESIRKNISIQEKLKSIATNIIAGKSFSLTQIKNRQKDRYEDVVFSSTGEKRSVKRVDY